MKDQVFWVIRREAKEDDFGSVHVPNRYSYFEDWDDEFSWWCADRNGARAFYDRDVARTHLRQIRRVEKSAKCKLVRVTVRCVVKKGEGDGVEV